MKFLENSFQTSNLVFTVGKTDQINVRVKPDLKADLDRIAEYRGLTVSSYVHSVLTAKVREEKDALPQVFREPGKVVATITPAVPDEADEIRRQLREGGIPLATTGKKIPLYKPDSQLPQQKKRKA